jgi:hypothetical protein
MRKILLYFPILFAIILLQSCDEKYLKPSITGIPYEILVVMDDKDWETEAGKSLFEMLSANTPGVAQSENMFNISRVKPYDFTRTMQYARNIIVVNISEIYSKTKIDAKKDVWAQPQIVVTINSPDVEQFVNALKEYHEIITDFIVQRELDRQIEYFKRHYNHKVTHKIKELFGIEMRVPSFISKYKFEENETETFFWASNMNPDTRFDIVIYSYPYTDPNTFTKEFLLAKRDSILKQHIPGPVPGSYMATELVHFEPTYKAINKNGSYCAEIRGWWRVEGDLMGGPFISHTQIDEINQRVITAEGFVYAPGIPKRNHIRRLEAVISSMKLPQNLTSQSTEEDLKIITDN